jgi:phage I-like protein
MPQILEACVAKLMKSPDFKPQGDQNKKSAAYAVCTASLKKANKMGTDEYTSEDGKLLSDIALEANDIYNKERKLKEKKAYEGRDVDLFSYLKAGEDNLPNKIQVMPIGSFNTLKYGEINLTASDLKEMADNFNLRAGVPIDVDHDAGKAAGWIRALEVLSDGLYADVEWTKYGAELLKNKEYRFLSPEFEPEYTDPEHSEIEATNVLIAASLVNRPLFKELKPLVASENLTDKERHDKITVDMNLDELRLKEKEALTAEELTFVTENKDKLTDDEKIHFGLVESSAKTADESEEAKAKAKAAEEAKAKADEAKAKAEEAKAKAEEAKAKAAEGAPDAAISGKEGKVTVQASEWNGLLKMKDEFETKKMTDAAKAWEFSEKGGKILPKSVDKVVAFMKSLNEKQVLAFSEIMNEIPDKGAKMFKEIGGADSPSGTLKSDTIEAKAKELMAKDKTGKMKFSEAVKLVSKENPELFERGSELKAVASKLEV